jgi:hypothetical protein
MEGRFAPMAAATVDFVNIILPPIGDWMACDFHISWVELEEVQKIRKYHACRYWYSYVRVNF